MLFTKIKLDNASTAKYFNANFLDSVESKKRDNKFLSHKSSISL